MFGETYYRRGLTSIGGHLFAGNRRSLANVVWSSDLGDRWVIMAAAGYDRSRGLTQGRMSVGGEYLTDHVALGVRLDHRTRQGRDPVVLAYTNVHAPFGPTWFRQAVRVQFEQTWQAGNMRSAFALSHVF